MIAKTINNLNEDITSFSKNENNVKLHKKLLLPNISNEYLPSEKKIKILNKINDNNNYFKQKSKKERKVFLTSFKEEEIDKNNIFAFNNTIDHENRIIHKMLSDKIIINNKDWEKENKAKLFQRNIILNKYMNEALLYRKSIFQRNKIQVGRIFKISGAYNKNKIIKEDSIRNKFTIDVNLNNKITEGTKKLRRFKTLDKNLEINNSNDYIKPNSKKINCNLKYNYNKNQMKIEEINTILNNLQEESKVTFDGFKNQAFKIIDKVSQKKD